MFFFDLLPLCVNCSSEVTIIMRKEKHYINHCNTIQFVMINDRDHGVQMNRFQLLINLKGKIWCNIFVWPISFVPSGRLVIYCCILVNVLQESTEYTYPNTVTFACDEGYVLTGQSILRCESNGQWSGSSPKCQPSGQYNLSVPLTVQSISTLTVPLTAPLTGQSILRCESNGQWSGSSSKCQPSGEYNTSMPLRVQPISTSHSVIHQHLSQYNPSVPLTYTPSHHVLQSRASSCVKASQSSGFSRKCQPSGQYNTSVPLTV